MSFSLNILSVGNSVVKSLLPCSLKPISYKVQSKTKTVDTWYNGNTNLVLKITIHAALWSV